MSWGLPFCVEMGRDRDDAGPLPNRAPAIVSPSESFQRFAEECGLRLTAEPLCVAPRDLLTPLEDVDQHFLVTLTRAGAGKPSVRLVFLAPVTAGSEPSLSEVLWWLAGDAWVLQRGNGEIGAWAAVYGYPATEEATIWLFEQATRQAAVLAALLGDSDMQRLLALYEAEIGPPRPR